MPLLSLIIPCYNEALNIPKLIARCGEVFAQRSDVEVILVNNGSRDDSAQVLAALLPQYPFARSVHVEVNQGYGFGILTGLRAAKGDWIGWTHADLQTDPADALAVCSLINSSGGTPAFYKGKRYGRRPFDLCFTMGMSLIDSVLLFTPLWDINAQPTIFPKSFFDSWQQPPHDFALDLYAYYLAKRSGLPVKRFPVFFGRRTAGTAHLNSLCAKLRYTKRTLLYSVALLKQGIR